MHTTTLMHSHRPWCVAAVHLVALQLPLLQRDPPTHLPAGVPGDNQRARWRGGGDGQGTRHVVGPGQEGGRGAPQRQLTGVL